MSTRSFIGVQNPNRTVRAIYCHRGGVGKMLYRHYQDTAKINALLDGGDVARIGSQIDAPEGHCFDNPAPDCTLFYRRDRGDIYVDAETWHSVEGLINRAKKSGILYIYLYADGEWRVQKVNGKNPYAMRPLADNFKQEDET